MKKIIVVLIMLSFILCVGLNVKARENDVWEQVTSLKEYETAGDYGTITLSVYNYKLADAYNQDSYYDYYAVKAVASMSLYPEYQHEENKFWGGIKFLWLNAGIRFKCYIDGYDEGDLELVSYSPQTEFTTNTYSTSTGLNLGFSGDDLEAGIETTFSSSYSTDHKTLINHSSMYEDTVDIDYIYDGYYIHDISASQYLMNVVTGGVVGSILSALEDGTVRHNDNYKTFQQTMTDGVSFIYRRPKSHTGGFSLCVFCYGTQLYIDYDWRNSHNFDEMMVMTGMMSIA